jgi:amino acid transporter/mannitol/fructose-specific phosphotransferase system IIA component (Ntr-type)
MAAAKLEKQLGLFDVYAISTGAMFSSGFFLLPGLAAASAGPSVVLAYAAAALFILPAMLSVAELSTAMPKAGGAYYFLDRSMGPMVGTVGGLGTWLALVLKSAFALVGMGAYLAIFVDVPIQPLAIGLTLLFMVVNIVGAKETSGLQRWLVTALLVILSFFVVQGLAEIFTRDWALTRVQFDPFMPFGVLGFFSTIGLVFVSYAGLTKVASVAEEVQNPNRNIPLGMFLSLATATFFYVVGVAIIVAVLEPNALREDLTPVATAAQAFFDWLPEPLGVVLIVVAATAAFASTGNAGMLSASRYPLAMARDRLVWGRFAELGRFGTPTFAVMTTGAAMAAAILLLDVEGIAKLASAFQLLLFALLNLSVIIMRESGIDAYDPGFRSPAYPWVQIFGMLGPLWLITEMGELAVVFTLVVVAVCVGWYFYYARRRVPREGAIFHTFARLGRRQDEGLNMELRGIVRERGLRDEDPFDEVVARAQVLDLASVRDFRTIAFQAAEILAARSGLDAEELRDGFLSELRAGVVPVARGVAIPHLRAHDVEHPEMVVVRVREGVEVEVDADDPAHLADPLAADVQGPVQVHALFFLVSPEGRPGQHLRLLAHLATHVDDDAFVDDWLACADAQALEESLLRDERTLTLRLHPEAPAASFIGRRLAELSLPKDLLVAMIRREGRMVVPHGSTMLEKGDRLTIIGEPKAIQRMARGIEAEEAEEAEG